MHKHFYCLTTIPMKKKKASDGIQYRPNAFISAVLHLFYFSPLYQLSEFYFDIDIDLIPAALPDIVLKQQLLVLNADRFPITFIVVA